jgi:hypothetical protein
MNAKNQSSVNASSSQLSLFSEVKKESPVLDTVHQYFLIIAPPQEIKSKVKSLKYKLHKAVAFSATYFLNVFSYNEASKRTFFLCTSTIIL